MAIWERLFSHRLSSHRSLALKQRSWRVEAAACRFHPAPIVLHTDALILNFQDTKDIFSSFTNKGMRKAFIRINFKNSFNFVCLHKTANELSVKINKKSYCSVVCCNSFRFIFRQSYLIVIFCQIKAAYRGRHILHHLCHDLMIARSVVSELI